MTRMPGATGGPVRKAMPDVYAALLLVGILFLATAIGWCLWDLMGNYSLSFGDLFSGAPGAA